MDEEYNVDCVLLIDDDEVTNFLNENLLAEINIGSDIKTTDNVKDALQFLKNCYLPNQDQKSLLIFLDINMPGLDGFDFLDELTRNADLPFQKLNIVILSSSLHKIDQERAEKYKILDYIVKPLTSEKLQAALSKKNDLGTLAPGFENE